MTEVVLGNYADYDNKELDEQIIELLDSIEYKNILKDGKFVNAFMKRVNGTFDLKNVANKSAIINFDFPTIESEIFVGKILVGDLSNLKPEDKKNPLYRVMNYRNVLAPIKQVYLDSIKYLNTKRIKENKKVKYVINPNTDRKIEVGKATAKKFFGRIKLKKVIYRSITNFVTVEYNIEDGENCVISYLYKKFGKKKINNLIEKKEYKDGITYKQIFKIAEELDFTCIARMPDGTIIDKYEGNDKKLDFIIHDEHMYVIGKYDKNKTKKDIIINNIEQIYNNEYKNLIILDYDNYKNIKNKIQQKYELEEYSFDKFKYKTNDIIFDANYKINKKILEDQKYKSKNIYACIESKFKLRGYINSNSIQIFQDINKIRIFAKNNEENIKLDQNKSYVHQLYKKIVFPVPCLNDYWKEYSNKIHEHGFYYCKLNKYDEILAPKDDIYTSYAVEILKKEKRIKEIISEFITEKYVTLNTDYLPPPNKNEEPTELQFPEKILKHYIGWLQKSINVQNIKFDNIKGDELEGMRAYYDDTCYTIDNTLNISKNYLVRKTGVLSNIIVKEQTNIDLYLFNKKVINDNKDAYLNSIKTDSLGYVLKNKFIKNDLCDDKKFGFFKIEKINNNIKKNIIDEELIIESIETHNKPKVIKEKKIKEYSINNIIELIDNKESFKLDAPAGYGKSYTTKHKIIKYMKDNDIKFLLTSTTNDNKNMWEEYYNEKCITIQSIFKKEKTIYEIKKSIIKYEYIIIDEAVQLSQDLLKYIEYFKNLLKINFIVLTDEYQCVVDDYDGKSYISTRFANELFDNNIIEIKEHKNIRYDDKLNEAVKYIRQNFDNKPKILKYIEKNFKIMNTELKNKLNLTYYLKTEDKINKIEKYKALTTHKAQGRTITENYTIHDLYNMPVSVIYTAISRAKNIDQISFYVS